MRAGVDTGGTFTDFVFWDGRRLRTAKRPSTPDDPARAVLAGLDEACDELVHGSTVATNALLERRGARTAFVATAGFEDLLELARQNRASLYDWFAPAPVALVPRELRFGLAERMDWRGEPLAAPSAEAVRDVADRVAASGAESVAVCLLHAYANPAHERAVGEALRGRGLAVSLSHEVLPVYREYERASTTAVNAYVSPRMASYLGALAERLGRGARLRVFQSNGGSMSAEFASRAAVHTVLSGPAGGAVGAVAVARAAGFERILAFDMGGTSTDVSLHLGAPSTTSEGSLDGLPIGAPMLDVHTVGAGGGSIAWLDSAGALRAGPRSAGARPGPICYGEGDELTVTDANLYLGRIDPERFLDGAMTLDVRRAASALERFALRCGAGPRETAEAIVAAANANMERAIRRVSVERGHDPRQLTLVAFGGAAGQHACALAERLGMPAVLAPRHAGVLSALGMLAADFAREYSQSVFERDAERALADLEEQARADLAAEGFSRVRCERRLDLRYAGQSYEIAVAWDERHDFDRIHQRLYGHSHPGRAVETVAARVRAVGLAPPESRLDLAAPSDDRAFASLYVPPGWRARQDLLGNTILERSGSV